MKGHLKQNTLGDYWPSVPDGRTAESVGATNRIRRKKKVRRRTRKRRQIQTKIVREFSENKQGHYGDHPSMLRGSGLVVAFQNVNGLWKDRGEGLQDALKVVTELGIDFMGITEVNMNSRSVLAGVMRRTIQKHTKARITYESNKEYNSTTTFQPGGVMTLRGPSFPKPVKEITDPTSTVQLTEIKVKEKIIGIITVYVPRKADGPMRVHTQCVNRIRRLGLMDEPVDVWEYQHATITKMARGVQEKGGLLIIGGDFNEEDSEKSKTTRMMKDLNLMNASQFHGGEAHPTFAGGRKAIDHIWVSEEILLQMSRMGQAPFNIGFFSDHRMVYVGLGQTKAREGDEKGIKGRILNSKNTKHSPKYLEELRRLLEEHNIFARMGALRRSE